MAMTIAQLRAFVAVSELNGFSRAANALHRTQPAITAQIKQLEEILGLKLIDRSTRQMALTAVGAELLPLFRTALGELDDAVELSRMRASRAGGTVRIASLPSIASIFLPRVITEFRAKHPRIAFQLSDCGGERAIVKLRTLEVEIAITDVGIKEADLEIAHLMDDHLCAYFLKGTPLGSARTIDVDLLAKCQLILLERGSAIRRQLEEGFAARGRHLPRPICETAHSSTALAMVRLGLGVALLPRVVAKLKPKEQLQCKQIHGAEFERQIVVARTIGRTLSPAAESFWEHLTQRLRPSRPARP